MATHSTVPVVKAAIKTRLEARSGLNGVRVDRVHPGDAELTEGIRIGDVHGHHDIAVMNAGRKRRDEQYTVDVFFEAALPGDDGRPAEERAFALLAEAEDEIADDPTLGGALTGQSGAAWAGAWDARTYLDGNVGWACTIRFEINVRARLS